MEVRNVIKEFELGWNLGNCIKYVLRCENKGNKLEDLRKALTYLRFEIDDILPYPVKFNQQKKGFKKGITKKEIVCGSPSASGIRINPL